MRILQVVEEPIDRVIADVRRYTEAGERLIERLQIQNRWNQDDIDRLSAGSTLMESVRATDSAARSRDLTTILAAFEESRREIRASVVAAALAEGATIVEISEIFGVSRQLANRFVKEHRARVERDPGGYPGPGGAERAATGDVPLVDPAGPTTAGSRSRSPWPSTPARHGRT